MEAVIAIVLGLAVIFLMALILSAAHDGRRY